MESGLQAGVTFDQGPTRWCQSRPPRIDSTHLGGDEGRSERQFHRLQKSPNVAVAESYLRRSSFNRIRLVDRLQNEAHPRAEHMLTADFQPDLDSGAHGQRTRSDSWLHSFTLQFLKSVSSPVSITSFHTSASADALIVATYQSFGRAEMATEPIVDTINDSLIGYLNGNGKTVSATTG